MKLNEIIKTDLEIEISNVTDDSRKASKGSLFFCIKGLSVDGHDYVLEAIKNGAVAVVSEKKLDISVPLIIVDDSIKELNNALSKFYDEVDKKLVLIGVTGTDGKTSISDLIYQLINKTKSKCALIGSNGIKTINYEKENEFTTPLVTTLFESFNDFYNLGCKYIAMEVSSERLLTKTIDEIKFDVSIFTHISRDHLNNHKTMKNYVETKSKLFSHMKENGVCIINNDDSYAETIKESCNGEIITYGINNEADIKATNVEIKKGKIEFDIIGKLGNHHISSNISGIYNVYNIISVIIALNSLGFNIKSIVSKLKEIMPISARNEFLNFGQNYNIMLDYAHTSNALKNLINYAKEFTIGKVVTITGSAGGKDPGKRPDMGKIVTDLSDYVIFTTDDPKSENPSDIINEMIKEVKKDNYEIIIDREDAIKKALKRAEKNDTIIIAGMGDDEYILKNGNISTDRKVIKNILNRG